MASPSEIYSWINKNFLIRNKVGNELQFNCPRCDHRSFYFNISSKRVGYCHRASCGWNPSLNDLLDFKGDSDLSFSGNEYNPYEEIKEEKVQEVELPPSEPIVTRNSELKLVSSYPEVVKILSEKRNIPPKEIMRWDMHTDGHKIYIPVYDNGKLVSYVGRIIWGLEKEGEKRYKYPSGTNISNYLFGWAEARYWDKMTLCENTFNSIAYRNLINCSTNFGSHLSDVQVEKIANAPHLKDVVFLWDEGAEKRAEKAVKKIIKNGIYSIYCVLPNRKDQPDNYDVETLKTWVEEAIKLSRKGRYRYVCRG